MMHDILRSLGAFVEGIAIVLVIVKVGPFLNRIGAARAAKRTTIVGIVLLALTSPIPAYAQWAVTDPSNLAEIRKIVDTTLKHLEQASAIRDHLQRAGQKLTTMEPYRTVPLRAVSHDVDRFPYGAALLNGLNAGDPRGALYDTTTRKLDPSTAILSRLTPAARRMLATELATIEVTDSANQRSIQVAGGGQVFGREVARALQALEDDVMNPRTAMHYQAAVLDKINGAGLINARQTEGVNQRLAAIVEHLIIRSKRERDAHVASMNRRLVALEHGPAANRALLKDATNAIRNWSQP